MATRADSTEPAPTVWRDITELYHQVLDLYYGRGQRAKAFPLALRLLRLLHKHDPDANTLLGMSGRWLVAELDGDLEDTIRYRERELNALRQHIASGLIENGGLVADEFADRLDLLASSYLDAKRYDDALTCLIESERFCADRGIAFDGKAIRADVKRAMRRRKPAAVGDGGTPASAR